TVYNKPLKVRDPQGLFAKRTHSTQSRMRVPQRDYSAAVSSSPSASSSSAAALPRTANAAANTGSSSVPTYSKPAVSSSCAKVKLVPASRFAKSTSMLTGKSVGKQVISKSTATWLMTWLCNFTAGESSPLM